MRGSVLLAAWLAAACGMRATGPGGVSPPAPVALASEVERGAELFASRGCAACHSIGAGLRVGPDLAGILERREPEWVVAMITRPDSMLRHDSIARDLRAEYGAAMPRLGIQPVEARALLAFVVTGDAAAPAGTEPRGCPCPGCGHGRHRGRQERSGR